MDLSGERAGQIAAVRPVAPDPDNNWNRFAVRLCGEVDHGVLKATVRKFFVNAGLSGMRKQVERAMAILRERKLPSGISSCYTFKNVEVIGSEAYFDQMVAWGARFCWLFTDMPAAGQSPCPRRRGGTLRRPLH